jgi:prevent-host-death family protein
MRSMTATEAKQNLAALLDAAQREPVMVRRHDRDVAVVLSPQQYDRLRGANIAEFQRLCDEIAERAAARGLTPEILEDILKEQDAPAAGD